MDVHALSEQAGKTESASGTAQLRGWQKEHVKAPGEVPSAAAPPIPRAWHTGDWGMLTLLFSHLPYISTINWYFPTHCIEFLNGSQLWLIFKSCSP